MPSAARIPPIIAKAFGDDADLYVDVLRTNPDATPDDLRKAYYKQGRAWLDREVRPDRQRTPEGADDDDAAVLKFQAVSRAYEILRDPSKRRRHDAERAAAAAGKENAAQNVASSLRPGGGGLFDLEDEEHCETRGAAAAKRFFSGIFGAVDKPTRATRATRARGERDVRSDVRMFSACGDGDEFASSGAAGLRGAFVDAFLRFAPRTEGAGGRGDVSFLRVLEGMRDVMAKDGGGAEAKLTPQLTSSRPFDVREKYRIVNPKEKDASVLAEGSIRRAVLIGIDYNAGTEFWASHLNVDRMKHFLTEDAGFRQEHITALMDDGEHLAPTKDNILKVLAKLAKESKPGDTVFCLYSGRGGWKREWTGDESDSMDELLYPVDFEVAGVIVDDDLFRTFVEPLREGVATTFLVDCSHSGTALDLPFLYSTESGAWVREAGRGAVAGVLRSLKGEADGAP